LITAILVSIGEITAGVVVCIVGVLIGISRTVVILIVSSLIAASLAVCGVSVLGSALVRIVVT